MARTTARPSGFSQPRTKAECCAEKGRFSIHDQNRISAASAFVDLCHRSTLSSDRPFAAATLRRQSTSKARKKFVVVFPVVVCHFLFCCLELKPNPVRKAPAAQVGGVCAVRDLDAAADVPRRRGPRCRDVRRLSRHRPSVTLPAPCAGMRSRVATPSVA